MEEAESLTADFRRELLESGLLVATSVDGLYHLSDQFERIVRGIAELVHRVGEEQDVPVLHVPPVLPRAAFERSGYAESFPQLIGSVSTFTGGEREHTKLRRLADSGGDWDQLLVPAEVVLCSAACHAIYPTLAGNRDVDAQKFEIEGFCFRHEPSLDPTRMQSFRMREFVFVGKPDAAIAHRELWLERSLETFSRLGLKVEAVIANDPFFGRAGRILATNQRDQELKYEIVTAAISIDLPVAIGSANYHQEFFGERFDVTTTSGEFAHSACFGFGLERVALTLIRTHGLCPRQWPAEVSAYLWPGSTA